ncbi:hypothetical protein EK21DRAFT_96727 [Setomelanomma holmii]|uniref:Uncharacterized protein n=1 Tax=Setomelanomma holmii TaxID=210430 RepID=A0A9P4HI43_9PLEO|nr:hypothetical protein EK21DRAFT_96727 [Setomelanomma holmii]
MTISAQHHEYKTHYFEQPKAAITLHRAMTEEIVNCVDASRVAEGRIFWLPSKTDLPRGAVRRHHGKGKIEDRIYDHPVVVVSRPAEASHKAVFHLITSLDGKKLEDMYDEAVPAQASRRTWYLPIWPTPEHPDAISKKTRKRFPTLKLRDGAMLKKESWVNIRHVYDIDISLLLPYNNPSDPSRDLYYFESQSMSQMRGKCKGLTEYEPGPQYRGGLPDRSRSELLDILTDSSVSADQVGESLESLSLEATSLASEPFERMFQQTAVESDRIAGSPSKVPPDGKKNSYFMSSLHDNVVQPGNQFLSSFQSVAVLAGQRTAAISLDPFLSREPLDRFWRDTKGATAVIIASL